MTDDRTIVWFAAEDDGKNPSAEKLKKHYRNEEVPLSKIKAPRTIAYEQGLYDTLKMSIQEHGILARIMLDADYKLVDGCLRYLVAKDLGIEFVPCIIGPCGD